MVTYRLYVVDRSQRFFCVWASNFQRLLLQSVLHQGILEESFPL